MNKILSKEICRYYKSLASQRHQHIIFRVLFSKIKIRISVVYLQFSVLFIHKVNERPLTVLLHLESKDGSKKGVRRHLLGVCLTTYWTFDRLDGKCGILKEKGGDLFVKIVFD